VASAVSVSVLIHEFHISELIFTGVAGGLQKDLRIGDIVVGSRLVQHDMDARPLLKRFEISTLNQIFMESPREQVETAKQAVESLIQDDDFYAHLNALESLQLQKPRLFVGDIASGDQFFACTMQKEALLSVLPTVLCVEMEGASVAQVCCEYALPFTIIRIISDSADENSSVDFVSFIKEIAGKYSIEIIKHILNHSFRNKKTG
jgi:adenosylhomocysteine nucleosidase